MTGIETLLLLKQLAGNRQELGGTSVPFQDLARIVRKLDAVLEHRGITVPDEETMTDAERAWILGDTVDAVMLHAGERGIGPVPAMEELKEKLGGVPIIGFVERRVDALLRADRIEWAGSE